MKKAKEEERKFLVEAVPPSRSLIQELTEQAQRDLEKMMKEKEPRRVQLLQIAAALTSGDRDKEYGPPYDNLSACADLFKAYFLARFRGETVDENTIDITAQDVAWLMVLTKISRTFAGNVKPDTYADAAAYAAIAGEMAEIEGQE